MSALGHYLEEEGLATVSISLIRPQTENTRPPRALWVPFELGRPFGPPGDPAFQRRVLLTALRLLERADGPVLLEDFPDDDPRGQADASWAPPSVPGGIDESSRAALAARLQVEVMALGGAHQRWVQQYGRTTVGVSGLEIAEAAAYVAEWLLGNNPESPREGFSAPLLLRFAIDDLKAYAMEAAAAGPAKPSSKQLGDWLWEKTATGAAIHALRAALLSAEDQRLRLIAENFIIPGARVRATG
ncbi:MAG TPA: hypothetical protein VMB73_33540 [Acetobacteraceae bacterium]|nr:hypothetical protein [Acetobacteraceae bacterium]